MARGTGTVPLQGELQEPFAQGAHMPVSQLPKGLILPATATWGPSGILVPHVWLVPCLLGCIVL